MGSTDLTFHDIKSAHDEREVQEVTDLSWHAHYFGRRLIPGESNGYFTCEHDARLRVKYAHLFIGVVRLKMKYGWSDFLVTYWMCTACHSHMYRLYVGVYDEDGIKYKNLGAYRRANPRT